MGAKDAALTITLGAEDAKLAKAFDKLQDNLDKSEKGFVGWARSVNESLNHGVEQLGKFNQAFEGIGKIVEFGKDAFKEYADDLRMRAAAGAADIDKLKAASLGLRTEDELLAFAAKTQHGAFKLTQEQMELAQKAMVGLTRAGFDQATVVDKVTDALVTGRTRGLKEFGIAVKATGDETESLNAIMGELATKAAGVDENSKTAAEGVQAAGVSMGDSINNMKQALGKLVAAMSPLLEALAKAVGIIADISGRIVGGLVGDGGPGTIDGVFKQAAAYQQRAIAQYFGRPIASGGGDHIYDPIADAAMKKYAGDVLGTIAAGGTAKGARSGGRDTAGPSFTMLNIGRDLQGTTDELVGAFQSALEASVKKAGQASLEGQQLIDQSGLQHADFQVGLGDFQKQAAEFQKAAQKASTDAAKQKEQSFLESSFGKLEEFNAYSTAFGTLTGAVTASMDAWIDGSESMGTAFKKAIGASLKALAGQMAVESLKHGAYALGSLAFGDVAGAGQHAAAAAAFGAGAIAAAAAAKELGGGGSAPKGSGGGGSGGGASGSAGGSGRDARGTADHRTGEGGGLRGRDTIVIMTESFIEGSPRMREQQARKYLGKVTGGQGWSND